MKTNLGNTNDTNFVGSDFIAKNTAVAVPYLILISIVTVTGSVGNLMVIGSVLTYKVCFSIIYYRYISKLADFNIIIWHSCIQSVTTAFSVKTKRTSNVYVSSAPISLVMVSTFAWLLSCLRN